MIRRPEWYVSFGRVVGCLEASINIPHAGTMPSIALHKIVQMSLFSRRGSNCIVALVVASPQRRALHA